MSMCIILAPIVPLAPRRIPQSEGRKRHHDFWKRYIVTARGIGAYSESGEQALQGLGLPTNFLDAGKRRLPLLRYALDERLLFFPVG
jgi:hypothetical protein